LLGEVDPVLIKIARIRIGNIKDFFMRILL